MTKPNKTTAPTVAAPFAYDGLDRVLHEKARLGIMTSLVGYSDGLAFAELKKLCGLTDGNLSRHIQVLEEAGMVKVKKTFVGKRPMTMCALTMLGRNRFAAYLDELERVVRDAEASHKALKTGLRLKPG